MISPHDHQPSGNYRKVRLVLAQLGIPYERVESNTSRVAHEGGFDLKPFPMVRAWLARISSQPSYAPMNGAS